MAIVKIIPFDDGLSDLGQFFAQGGWDGTLVSTTNPRTGTHVLNVGGGNLQVWRTNFPASYATGWVYFALRIASLPASGDGGHHIYLLDNGTIHLRLSVRSDGGINLYRGDGVTLLANGTAVVMAANVWTHFAVKYTIADAAGICQVRYNGLATNDINYSGDTRNGAAAVVNQLQFGEQSQGSLALQVDDIVIQDTTGAAPENDWLGDVGLYPILPTANDASAGYAVGGTTPAATLWESVDDPTSDEMVTTIDSSVVGDYASFEMQDIPAALGTIYAVVNFIRAAKSAAGLREIQGRQKLGATVVLSANLPLSTTMTTVQGIFHRDPDGATWTVANVNSAKMGVRTAS